MAHNGSVLHFIEAPGISVPPDFDRLLQVTSEYANHLSSKEEERTMCRRTLHRLGLYTIGSQRIPDHPLAPHVYTLR